MELAWSQRDPGDSLATPPATLHRSSIDPLANTIRYIHIYINESLHSFCYKNAEINADEPINCSIGIKSMAIS